ncbi:hypothetical protein [Sinosporangium album]|uniref:hypothetical protein n=1 Tax=Sinosporangium album TaxID=504805 RepID=UPI000B89CC7F|nr:hypothetical protein [Sinosporangium album]
MHSNQPDRQVEQIEERTDTALLNLVVVLKHVEVRGHRPCIGQYIVYQAGDVGVGSVWVGDIAEHGVVRLQLLDLDVMRLVAGQR